MRRLSFLVLGGLVTCLAVGCNTEEDVPAAKQMTPTPEPTPTPTPTPEPIVPEADYHVTTMTVATTKSDAVDIDGDGKPDYGLESALNEISRFMVGRIDNILSELVDADLIPQEAALALKTAAVAMFQSTFSVDTIDEGLKSMLKDEQWIQVLSATGETSVEIQFYSSTPVSADTYNLANALGDPFDGSFDEAAMMIDVSGGSVTLSIPIAGGGVEPLVMTLPLTSCRDIQPFDPDGGLSDARLGGAISIGSLVDMVTKMMDLVGILGLMPEDMANDLKNDVERFISGLGDVTIDGEEAISVSLVYGGSPVSVR